MLFLLSRVCPSVGHMVIQYMSQRCEKEYTAYRRESVYYNIVIPVSTEAVAFALLCSLSMSCFNIHCSGFCAGQSDLDFSLT